MLLIFADWFQSGMIHTVQGCILDAGKFIDCYKHEYQRRHQKWLKLPRDQIVE